MQDVEILCERCRDKALSVRKQAIASLTEVFWNFQDNIYVQRYFILLTHLAISHFIGSDLSLVESSCALIKKALHHSVTIELKRSPQEQ